MPSLNFPSTIFYIEIVLSAEILLAEYACKKMVKLKKAKDLGAT